MGEKLRFSYAIAASALLVPGLANAEAGKVRQGPAPAWVTPSEPMAVPDNATGQVFFRRQDALIHLDAQGAQQYSGYRIRILHPSALQAGNIAIVWNPAFGEPTVHAIRLYRGAETIDVLKTSTFEILRREDQLEASMLTGNLTAVLRVADLRVGDELEVAFTTRVNDPVMGKTDAGVLFIGPSPAPGRYRLGLSWSDGRKPVLKLSPEMAAVAQYGAGTADFRFDNPGVKSPPKDAPGRYQWQRVIEYSEFANWEAISRHFAPLYLTAQKLPAGSPVRAEAARIAAAQPGALDRTAAALRLVQQDVRYVFVGLDGGNLTPAAAESTWQRRYGDCKGKAALLLGLLAEMGIDAEPVLVNSIGLDDGLDQRLPSPRMFDHVIVRAHIDGKSYWLDATLPPVVPPGAEPAMPYRWVLPLTTAGAGLDHIAWHPAKRPDQVTLYDLDASAGFDQPARVTHTTIMRGVEGLTQQLQLSGLSHDQMVDAFRQQIIGSTWQSVDDVRWRYDQKAAASILTITGTWTLDWEKDGGGARSLALPGGGFVPPDRRSRPADQDQDVPYYIKPDYDCQVARIRFPATARGRFWTTKTGFDDHMFGSNYYRRFDIRDDSIRMVRGRRVDSVEIDAATARRDNARVGAFDNSMAWIYYDPASPLPRLTPAKAAAGSGGAGGGSAGEAGIPAPDEIDWTADTVPCLAPSAMH